MASGLIPLPASALILALRKILETLQGPLAGQSSRGWQSMLICFDNNFFCSLLAPVRHGHGTLDPCLPAYALSTI